MGRRNDADETAADKRAPKLGGNDARVRGDDDRGKDYDGIEGAELAEGVYLVRAGGSIAAFVFVLETGEAGRIENWDLVNSSPQAGYVAFPSISTSPVDLSWQRLGDYPSSWGACPPTPAAYVNVYNATAGTPLPLPKTTAFHRWHSVVALMG